VWNLLRRPRETRIQMRFREASNPLSSDYHELMNQISNSGKVLNIGNRINLIRDK
jgi:hypothetical protein